MSRYGFFVLLCLVIFLFVVYQGTEVSASSSSYDSPFGFHTSFYPPKRLPGESPEAMRKKIESLLKPAEDVPYSAAMDLGVKWERASHPVLGWTVVQRNKDDVLKGIFNWTIPDAVIKNIPKDLNLVVTIKVGGTKSGTWQFIAPDVKSDYINFVKKAVERYNGDGINDMPGLKSPVKFWQVENEPEVSIGSGGPNENFDWKGFAEILKATYDAIKSVDPNAKVLSAGMVSPPRPDMREKTIEKFWEPLLKELNGRYIDIFDFHWFDISITDSYGTYKKMRDTLDKNGFAKTEIWMTETGLSSKPGERIQAIGLVKRFVYPLSYGVKKVFWAWSLIEGFPPFNCNSIFDYTGLIYDGFCPGDPGYGAKKLGYYTYKLMTRKLEGSSWGNIKTISNGENNVYAFKFPKTGGEVYVIWYENEGDRKINFNLKVQEDGEYIVTNAVPDASEGRIIKSFSETFGSKKIVSLNKMLPLELTPVPIYVERSGRATY